MNTIQNFVPDISQHSAAQFPRVIAAQSSDSESPSEIDKVRQERKLSFVSNIQVDWRKMQLAVSNIAWGMDDFEAFLRLLEGLGCHGVELAPSLMWDEPIQAAPSDRRAIKRMVEESGLRVVGFHALLYHRPDLLLFSDRSGQAEFVSYLKELSVLCKDIGGHILIFGSPRNRARGQLSRPDAITRAAQVFHNLAEAARSVDTVFCIEPLGVDECDFINSADEAMELVRRVDHANFRLHLDGKAMISSREDSGRIIPEYSGYLHHFHISEPGLAPPGTSGANHRLIGQTLRQSGYDRFVSIEMRRGFGPPIEVITRSVEYVKDCYFPAEDRCAAKSV